MSSIKDGFDIALQLIAFQSFETAIYEQMLPYSQLLVDSIELRADAQSDSSHAPMLRDRVPVEEDIAFAWGYTSTLDDTVS